MRKIRTLTLRGVWLPVGALYAALFITCPAQAGDHDRPIVRGEMARLYRQAYDYNYRNSNRNVFRSSRHYHPTKNVFRSSRYYQGRLASSFDGYTLRSTIQYSTGNTLGGLQHGRSVSVVHPRRHPTGPVGFYDQGLIVNRRAYPHDLYQSNSRGYQSGGSAYRSSRSYNSDANKVVTYTRNAPPQPEPPAIQLVPISACQAEATQQVVMRSITQADGSTRMVITSEPINAGLDEAWDLVEQGEVDAAAEIFARNSLDEKRGAEAMLGYALAKAQGGDESAARTTLQRAMLIENGIVSRIRLTESLRKTLDSLLEKQEVPQPEVSESDGDEEAVSPSAGERD